MNKVPRLYNVFFPLWFLLAFPPMWVIVLPVNFVIDSLVLLLCLKINKIVDTKLVYKKTILMVWIFGFLADIAGGGLMMTSQIHLSDWWYQNITNTLVFNPFTNIYSFLLAFAAVILSGVCIYLLNLRISFKKIDLDFSKKRILALLIAVITSPWIFLFPSGLLYK